MNELSKFLAESILEDENPIKKVVVIYGGRFQPFHKGHYGTYKHLKSSVKIMFLSVHQTK